MVCAHATEMINLSKLIMLMSLLNPCSALLYGLAHPPVDVIEHSVACANATIKLKEKHDSVTVKMRGEFRR